MVTYYSRSAWTAHGPAEELTKMSPGDVLGCAVHWPGSKTRLGLTPTLKQTANRLEGYRRWHTSGRGWSDIAYQVAVDQAGRVFDLRGIGNRSAANGDDPTNRRWGALLLLLGPGEQPTGAMLDAIADWHKTRWLDRYPSARKVVGHQDVRPDGTDCPGPIVQRLIESGAILEGGDDMPLTAQEIKAIAEAVLDAKVKLLQDDPGGHKAGKQVAVGDLLSLTHRVGARGDYRAGLAASRASKTSAELAAISARLDAMTIAVEAIGQAVPGAEAVAEIRRVLDEGATAIRDELSKVEFRLVAADDDA